MAVIKGKLDLGKKDIEESFEIETECGLDIKCKISCNLPEFLLVKEYFSFSVENQDDWNIAQAEAALDSIFTFQEDYGFNFSSKIKVFTFALEHKKIADEKKLKKARKKR